MSVSPNRRELALAVGAIWAGLGFAGPAEGQTPPAATPGPGASNALSWTPKALSPDQARVLDAVAELIMPQTETPGARAVGVPPFVDRALADYCTPADADAVRAGLDRLDADARAAHGRGFAVLTADQQTALLVRYDGDGRDPRPEAPPAGRGETQAGVVNRIGPAPVAPAPRFFALLKELVTVGYFTSPIGATQVVRWDPSPGAYRGCVPLAEIGASWVI